MQIFPQQDISHDLSATSPTFSWPSFNSPIHSGFWFWPQKSGNCHMCCANRCATDRPSSAANSLEQDRRFVDGWRYRVAGRQRRSLLLCHDRHLLRTRSFLRHFDDADSVREPRALAPPGHHHHQRLGLDNLQSIEHGISHHKHHKHRRFTKGMFHLINWNRNRFWIHRISHPICKTETN